MRVEAGVLEFLEVGSTPADFNECQNPDIKGLWHFFSFHPISIKNSQLIVKNSTFYLIRELLFSAFFCLFRNMCIGEK